MLPIPSRRTMHLTRTKPSEPKPVAREYSAVAPEHPGNVDYSAL